MNFDVAKRRYTRAAFAGLLLVSMALAWSRRFVLDDAFISFRYAKHFVEGHGLVWNMGERVEGYTSFLWTLIAALPIRFGWDPGTFSVALGPLLLAGSLCSAALLAARATGSRSVALVSALLLGTNSSFISFASGGLETQLLALLLTSLFACCAAATPLTARRLLGISLLTAACLLTRLDSAPALLPAWVLTLWQLRAQHQRNSAAFFASCLWLSLPVAGVLSAWFAWKLSFYGALLPNTFYAKVDERELWGQGARFLASFLNSFLLWPCAALLCLSLPRVVRGAAPAPLIAIFAALFLTYAYLASVGGDFMEFRFLVPTLPLFFTASSWAMFEWLRRPAARLACAGFTLIGSLHHALTFTYADGVESVELLQAHLISADQNWIAVGKALRAALPADSDVRIATTAAGAIPYYSGLPALDMLGLTDAWIPRHGARSDAQIGHARVATTDYLVQRNVHLVLAHPLVGPAPPAALSALSFDILQRFTYLVDVRPDNVPLSAALIAIPLPAGRVVLALNLLPHPDVTAAVRRGVWRRLELLRPQPRAAGDADTTN